MRHKRKTLSKPIITVDFKNSVFTNFFKDLNIVQLLASWDKLFQISGALNEIENALPPKEFDGIHVSKNYLKMITKLLLVYIYLDLEYMCK